MLPRFKSILISVTEKCHVGCAHCGFIGAIREREPEPQEMVDWVRQSCDYGVPFIIFTGGEPFERFDCLIAGVAAAAEAGKPSAVFTSSYWASSKETTRETLARLPGLRHLYLSSDPFHQRRVPYQNVFNVIDVALEFGIPDISICITYTNEEELFQVRSQYASYGDRLRYHEDRVIPNPYFSRKVLSNQGALRGPRPEEFGCECWIGTPIINPNGDVFSCHAGKAAAHRSLRHLPYFLGNLHEGPFGELMERAGARPEYQFLRTHGPGGVASLYSEEPGLADAVGRASFTTACDMCFSTLKTPAGVAALKRHVARPAVRDEIDMRLVLVAHEEIMGSDSTVHAEAPS